MYSLARVAALTFAAAISVAGLSACNTVEGAGRDVKSTGKAIERSAQEEKAEHAREEQREDKR